MIEGVRCALNAKLTLKGVAHLKKPSGKRGWLGIWLSRRIEKKLRGIGLGLAKLMLRAGFVRRLYR